MSTEKQAVDMDLVVRWIDALESGEYERGEGWLRRGDTYCCLGVLCNVFDPNKWAESDTRDDMQGDYFDEKSQYLPIEIADRVGLGTSGQNWEYDWKHEFTQLTQWNDEGATFPEIAAALREHYGLPPKETPNG